MLNRGMVKWAPFNSVINGNDTLNSICKEKSKFDKPTLSEEQISDLEEKIISSYSGNIEIDIIYYKNKMANKTSGIIVKIDPVTKKITLNTGINLYFYNILQILDKNA